MYGAKKGKILNVFIDDLSLPLKDQFGTQEVNEVRKSLLNSLKNKIIFFSLSNVFNTVVSIGDDTVNRQSANIANRTEAFKNWLFTKRGG